MHSLCQPLRHQDGWSPHSSQQEIQQHTTLQARTSAGHAMHIPEACCLYQLCTAPPTLSLVFVCCKCQSSGPAVVSGPTSVCSAGKNTDGVCVKTPLQQFACVFAPWPAHHPAQTAAESTHNSRPCLAGADYLHVAIVCDSCITGNAGPDRRR